MSLEFARALTGLLDSPVPDPALVRASFEAILTGSWTPVQVGAFAAALRARGETAEVIAEAARALRAAMTPVEHGLPSPVLDTCGTGGDGAQTINVSTAAAIVVAACGVAVAKHGNRSISSRSGSADVVAALGIPLELSPLDHARVLRETNITFLFAPAHHPALKHAAQARRELGVRTIFNALGPLCNPGRATHQLLGVYDDALRPVLARVLAQLGTERAWVVRSLDGLDEISPSAPTRVSVVEAGEVSERVVAPEDFGFARTGLEVLRGGTPEENAQAVTDIVVGKEHAARDAVLLNAAAALVVAGRLPLDAAAEARDAVASGRAAATLEAWRTEARRRC
jgi:anthranilate phosphoribosyltransferase